MDDIDNIDYKILREVGSMSVVQRPFNLIAEKVGISERDVILRIEKLKDAGIIRRIGISVAHRKAGMKANAMCICKVPEDRVDSVGQSISSFPEVTHCYTRQGFEYNMFFMVHTRTMEQCMRIINRISDLIGIPITPLFSEKEFKKTSFTL